MTSNKSSSRGYNVVVVVGLTAASHVDAFSCRPLHTDIAAAAFLTHTQLPVHSRVDRSVRPCTSIVPPKMILSLYMLY